MSEITPSQTVGPFFAYGLTPHSRSEWRPEQGKDLYDWKVTAGANLVTPDATGTKIRIEGCVLDGDGMPINDAMIEVWQADAQGRYAHPADSRARPNTKFMGFGRSSTDKNGIYSFDTVSRGRSRAQTGRRRHHTSCSAFFRAACSGRSIPASIFPTRHQTPTIPS